MHDVIKFDPHRYRYPSRRGVVYGSRGMVATSQPLASQAGLAVLKMGGNAVDAAIATAAALTVVEPTSNGLGSDAFAMIWKDGKLHGINGSGFAPRSLSPDFFQCESVPYYGWPAVTVPGAVATWCELSKKMGKLPLKDVLSPAVEYARKGYAVSVTAAFNWKIAFKRHASMEEAEFREWGSVFAPYGKAPAAGEVFASAVHADTLEKIAATCGEAFYRGDVAEKIADFARRTGGFITAEDLADFVPEWVEPIGIDYRGYKVWEIPPNGQGICALIALNILKGFDLRERDSAETFHKQIESIKLGFADAHRYVADQRFSFVPVQELLDDRYSDRRRELIAGCATDFKAGDPMSGGTVYLTAADKSEDGEVTMVSFIQSNYAGFGSGVVCPGTGVAFNNRGACFSLSPGHPNILAGGKRPYNTIIPAFLSRDGKPIGPFGVMGGFMQPQGHLQVVSNVVDFGMNPQEALDAPRWQWIKGLQVEVEPGFPSAPAQALARMGHEIVPQLSANEFGRGEIIWLTEHGTFAGATEPRTDGCVAAW